MNRLLPLVSALLIVIVAATARADSETDRLATAKRYVEIAENIGYVRLMLSAALSGQPVVGDPEFIDSLESQIDKAKLKDDAARALAQHYTTEELNYMVAHFSTETGLSILRKRPAYLQDLGVLVQGEVQRAVKAMMEQKTAE